MILTDTVNKNESAMHQYFLKLKQQASESDRDSRPDEEAAVMIKGKISGTDIGSECEEFGQVITSNSNGAIII